MRHILRIELIKFLGCLRTDDSIFMNTVEFKVNRVEGVIEGSTDKTKSTEQKAGTIVGGMPFRLPLLPSLGHKWYKNYVRDAVSLGFRHDMDFIIPLDERAFDAGLPVSIANSETAVKHLRSCLREAGFPPEVYKAVSEHTAKRTGAAVIRLYMGDAKMDTEEFSNWLHHRATGAFKSVGPYNPEDLVVPCKKAKIIWEEWLQSADLRKNDKFLPWFLGRLKLAK